MSDQLQMFEEEGYQKSTSSLSEVLAKTLVWLEKEKEWVGLGHPLSPKQLGLSENADQVFLSGKMLKELSPQTMAQTFGQLSKPLQTLGVIDLNGNCLIQSGFLPQNRERIYLGGCLGKGSGQQIFPITKNDKKTDELQGQQANTCTLTARYEAAGNGSYVVERKLNAQDIIVGDYRNDAGFRPRKDGDTPCLMANKNSAKELSMMPPILKGKSNKNFIRRLTPKECERLQGFPDDWTKTGKELGTISDSQRYKMCGNAVTVDVVQAVAKNIKKAL